MSYARWVTNKPLKYIENRGPTSLLSNYSEDIRRISAALEYIPEIGISFFAIVGGLGYLTWVSWPITLLACIAVVPASYIFIKIQHRVQRAQINMLRSRDSVNNYYAAMINGIKELKLDSDKRSDLLKNYLYTGGSKLSDTSFHLAMNYTLGSLWTQSCYFIAITVVLLLVSVELVSTHIVAPYILVALFLKSYIFKFMSALPHWTAAGAIIEQFRLNGFECNTVTIDDYTLSSESTAISTNKLHIEARNIGYSYISEHNTRLFSVGPLSLTLDKPEIVFITGQNGSGKSTFLKVLCGLYEREAGDLFVNGQTVDENNIQDYRTLFSVLFTVPYIFQELPLQVPSDPIKRKTFEDYLVKLQLDGKINPDRVTQTPELSHGQIKRLGLLMAMMDNRPIIVFDEWAENQDPAYKDIFYHDILPGLRDAGKIVVVVTHESQYFSTADRQFQLT